jgi:hypothetical protein
MTSASSAGALAFWFAVLLLGIALVKHRGRWGNPEVLVPIALVLVGVHWVVPMSEGIQVVVAYLSIGVSVWAAYYILRGALQPAKREQ